MNNILNKIKILIFGLKFKKTIWIVLSIVFALSVVFLRVVPDYSAKLGFKIIDISDYNKYKQGYCLKENRILSKEELLQNLAINYFKRYHDYEVLRNTIIDEHDMKNFGSRFYKASISKLYLIGDFNEENWFDFLVENTDRKSFDYEIKDKKQINISDLSKYFIYKNEILGFRQPIILSEEKNPLHGGKMFLEKSFLIKENQFFVNYARPGYISWYIELNHKEDLIKIKNKENLMRIKSGYESLENFNEVLAYTHMKHLRRKFLYDNCGNINFNIKAPAEQELDMFLNDLEFIRKDGNLLIKVKDNSHTITVEDILSRNAYERFNLKFADGTIVNQYDINLKVLGSDGNDRLLGESRNDIIIGEKGDDELYGNGGSDTYIYKRGDGNDTIGEYVRDDSDYNVLHFIDMTRDDVEFSRENNNLLIKIKDTGEIITTTDFFSMYGHKTAIDSFKFLDGTILSSKELKDSLLMGDDKDNYIIGYYSNDTLIGGKGDDTMEGGRGNDTYIYYKGDGNDTIDKIYGNSTIDFKDLNKDDVEILSQDSNLLVRIKENNETITIKDILSSNNFYKVNLKFLNGGNNRQ